jgi:5-methylcytosine-specific restriction endonuclease McrA
VSWFRIDDKLMDHPKWLAMKGAALDGARNRADARARAKDAALVWTAAGVWGAGNNCDGIIPEHAADTIAPRAFLTEDEFHAAAELLVKAGLWHRLPKSRGGPGWKVHDWHDYQLSKQQVQQRQDRDARKKALYRTVEGRLVVETVKRRDGDRCRYCWEEVVWADRRSAKRGTVDHVDPDGPNSIENCVVACGSCNRAKADRTPEEADMLLRPAYWGDTQDLAASGRDLVATDSRPSLTRGSGRVRSGQVGPERDGTGGAGTGREATAEGGRRAVEVPPHSDDHFPGEDVA